MTTAAPDTTKSGIAQPIEPSAPLPPVNQLVQRLSAEVDTAEQRVLSLQTEAENTYFGQGHRLMRFVTTADRIHVILLSRLQAFMSMSVFSDVQQSVSLDSPRPDSRDYHSRTTTLAVPCSDKRPTSMEFSFRVGHDGPLQNLVLDYRLAILPMFIKFNGHDQLVVPIDELREEPLSEWIDDKLVGFTKTYFEVYFNDQYQKQSLETDVVLNVRFPRAMAVGTREFQTRTYHFYTAESSRQFEQDPSRYVQTVGT